MKSNTQKTLNEIIDSLQGKVTQSNFDEYINEHKPINDQLLWLTEDMLLVEFQDNILLDVSWHDNEKNSGLFIVSVIQHCNWEHPLLKVKCRTFTGLKKAIEKAHTFILNSTNNITMT